MSGMGSRASDPRYHIVGIRLDGSRAVLGNGMSMLEARRVRDALAAANIFRAVQIKPLSERK